MSQLQKSGKSRWLEGRNSCYLLHQQVCDIQIPVVWIEGHNDLQLVSAIM